ncbi:MAG: MFS transporter [Streptosporangiales bacterium]|nr:MFS transporter [Streptosporangiales bacterium]
MSFVGDLRAVVRGRDFRRLYATRLVSQASDGIFQVGLASWVFFSPERQPTAARTAAAFAVLLLPYSLVGPFAGVLLDRWRRRQILVFANIVRAALIAIIAALVATGLDGPFFFGTALAALSVNRFFLAGLSAALPHVVARQELIMANSVSTTSGTIIAVAGGGVGYLLRLAYGSGDVSTALLVGTAGVAYLCSAGVAATMGRDLLGPDYDPDRPQTREALGRVLRGLTDGARHVYGRRRAGAALAAIAAHRFFYGISTITALLLYRNYFYPERVEAGLGGLALVFAASGVGFFVAALVTPQATARMRKQTWIVLLLVLACVVEIVLGVPFREAPFVAAAFVLGVVSQGVKICVDTLVQENIDDAYRGRVFSFYDVLFNVSFVSAAAFTAVAAPENGKSYAILGFIALGYGLTALGYGLASRNSRRDLAEMVERGSTISARSRPKD